MSPVKWWPFYPGLSMLITVCRWKYTCVNLYQLIFDYRGEESISRLEVRWVMLKRPLDATEKYYFDHVTFSRNSPIDVTEERMYCILYDV